MYSETPKDHLIHLREVLQRSKDAGLKLKLSKCEFFCRSLMHLVHGISKNVIETDSHKMQLIRDWPVPKLYKLLSPFHSQICMGHAAFV